MKNYWNIAQRIAFMFFFLLFGQLIFVDSFGRLVPIIGDFLHWVVPLFSKTFSIVSYEITTFENGSGDTTYNWVRLLMIFLVSLTGSIIWAFVATKNTNFDRLNYWFMVALRFYVASVLIEYGMIKIWKLQFPYPSPYRLSQYYGDSSPMGLAWTFLGFSKGYNIFMGIAEILAALLYWRRTVTVGAIITLMTTANVVAINFFYDVPVKIYSSTLFLMTSYILVFNVKDLLLFFFTSSPVTLTIQKAYRFSKKYLNVGLYSLKYILIAFSLLGGAYFSYTAYEEDYNAPRHALFGYYEKANSLSDSMGKWAKINFRNNDFLKTYNANGTTYSFSVEIDSLKKQLTLSDYAAKDSVFNYSYQMQGDTLRLSGLNNHEKLMFLRKNVTNSRLMNRGFHWINETPYNF